MLVSKFNLIAEARRVTNSWDEFDYEPANSQSRVIRSKDQETLLPLLRFGYSLKQTHSFWIAYKGEIQYKRGTYKAYEQELLEINKHKYGEDMYYIRRNPHEKWQFMKDIRAQMCGLFKDEIFRQKPLDEAMYGKRRPRLAHYILLCNWSDPASVLNLIEKEGLHDFYWCDHRGIPFVLDVPSRDSISLEELIAA